jgi:hypothetical protein
MLLDEAKVEPVGFLFGRIVVPACSNAVARPKIACGSSGINASARRRWVTASSMRLKPMSMPPRLRRV